MSGPHVDEFGEFPVLEPGLVEGLFLQPPRRLLPLLLARDSARVNAAGLLDYSDRYLPVLLVDPLELPDALLVQG